MRRAFTIIELLVAISIICILMTIVFRSIRGQMSAARTRHAEALCQAVESGLATYHTQKDEWPEPVGGWTNGNPPSRSNAEGKGGQSDPNVIVLTASEVKQVIKALIDEAKKGNPLMDISGLWVSRASGEGGKGYGLSFLDAVHGTNRSRKRMSTGEMNFGYPDPETGHFRRFKMVYSIPTDSILVSMQ